MITFSGVQMHPGCGHAPEPVDIAVAMCRITRYAGAVWCPLAVHSLIVAEYMRLRKGTDLAWTHGLLHDAHETVTGEITRHYKPPGMKSFEQELDEAIFEAFHLDYLAYRQNEEFVKEADEKALCAEAVTLELKNWPAYYLKREGRPIPTLSATEKSIARAILDSPWRSGAMVSEASPQVESLAAALKLVQEKDLHGARQMVSPIAVI